MSRGGRGGGRGGMRLNGGHPEWEIGQVLDSKPSELFPRYNPPMAIPATDKEKREVEYYLKLRNQFHQSTLYTKSSVQNKTTKTYGEDQFNDQYHRPSKADIDPFVGVPTYSEKYEPKARTIPQLTGTINKEFFPKELWSTLEGEDGDAVSAGVNRAIRKKAALFSIPDPLTSGMAKKLSLEDKIKNATADADLDSDVERDEDELPEEENDYDFEDDDDDMGGDYNGEQYFDGGDNEDDDDGDGGGGDAY